MSILGIIALYKILEVSVLHRILLQGKVHIRPQVIDPDLLGLHIGARGTLIEKDDIRLDAGFVEDTGRQAQDRMQIGGFEQLLTHRFTGAALKQDIVGDGDSRFAACLSKAPLLNRSLARTIDTSNVPLFRVDNNYSFDCRMQCTHLSPQKDRLLF